MGKRVVRTRSGLRMVLHGEERELAMANPSIVPSLRLRCVTSRSGAPGMPFCIANHRESMVLRGDKHLAGAEIMYRMVSTPVAVGQLRGFAPEGEAHQLVSEADPERGETVLRRGRGWCSSA